MSDRIDSQGRLLHPDDQVLHDQLVERFGSDHPDGNDRCRLCGCTYVKYHAYRPNGMEMHSRTFHFNFVCLYNDGWLRVAELNG
jgi:hypothetical protein